MLGQGADSAHAAASTSSRHAAGSNGGANTAASSTVSSKVHREATGTGAAARSSSRPSVPSRWYRSELREPFVANVPLDFLDRYGRTDRDLLLQLRQMTWPEVAFGRQFTRVFPYIVW